MGPFSRKYSTFLCTLEIYTIPECSVVKDGYSGAKLSYVDLYEFLYTFRNGVVCCESIMKLRSKLEELGKMKGVSQDKKG